MTAFKAIVSRFKPYLRWLILGGTLFFVASTLHRHWQGVAQLRIDRSDWLLLGSALMVTLVAHIWSGWVWSLILRSLDQAAGGRWGILVYLKTNIAKYLPGNVWHLYGRILAAKQAGFPAEAATLSVLLEPLLMAAAALSIALISHPSEYWVGQLMGLAIVLIGVHPIVLNPVLAIGRRMKGQYRPTGSNSQAERSVDERSERSVNMDSDPSSGSSSRSSSRSSSGSSLGSSSEPNSGLSTIQVHSYPLLPLLGEVLFVGLRGAGFILTVVTLTSLTPSQLPVILSAFSVAWMLGLVIPGAPGGIGVFEATAIALLDRTFDPAVILGSVALYRLMSTLAEVAGAGLAVLVDGGPSASPDA